jgi:shikimate kinase
MKIYLIGYMGSGKSTLGKDLAGALGISWTDLDDEFETKYRISIPDFFRKYGEDTFRELEHKLLTDISAIPDQVVSTGGGTPCFHGNMPLMNQSGLTIYLLASPELLLSRIGTLSRHRPVFQQMQGDNALQNLTRHLESRKPYYEQAKITIEAASPDIQDLKHQVLNFFDSIIG